MQKLNNRFDYLLFFLLLLFSSLAYGQQCPDITGSASTPDCTAGCTVCVGDSISFTVTGQNLPNGGTIDWYVDPSNNFVPPGQGTFIGSSGINTTPPAPCTVCPEIQAVFIDACNDTFPEPDNEFMVITSGSGFEVNNLQIDYASQNNGFNDLDNDINFGANPCGFQTPQASLISGLQMTANCNGTNIIPAGPGDTIPPGVIVVVFTSGNVTIDYDFDLLCATGETIYILQSSCVRTIGAFTNGSNSGTRTTRALLSNCSCTSILTHDTGDPAIFPPTDGDFAYKDSLGVVQYDNNGCIAPPVENVVIPPTPSQVDSFTYVIGSGLCSGGMSTQYVVGIINPPPGGGCTQEFTNYFQLNIRCPDAFATSDTLCGDASGQATFNLNALNNTVNGGNGNLVFWYLDSTAMNPVGNPNGFTTGSTTVYAITLDGFCVSPPVPVTLVVNNLNVTPAVITCAPGGNNPCSVCDADGDGMEDVTVDFFFPGQPPGVGYDIEVTYGNGGSGFNTQTINNFMNGNNQTFTITDTTQFFITLVTDPNGCVDSTNLSDTLEVFFVLPPQFNNPGNQSVCDSFVLPPITGTGLTGNEAYYTAPNGGGTQLGAGSVITTTTTLYIFGGAPGCTNEVSFTVTVTPTADPSWTPPAVCFNDPPVTLTPDGTSGGTWTGIGVTDNGDGTATFDPGAPGADGVVTYTAGTPPCDSALTQTIPITALVITNLGIALCNDNGTPSDPTDDVFTFTIRVSGTNAGATWTASDPNNTTAPYDSVITMGPYPISGGGITFTITDNGPLGCSTGSVTILPPAPCSSACGLDSTGLANVLCNDNGTPSDPADDYLTFDLNPTGSNLGSTYNVTVNMGTISPGSGTYGGPATFQLQNGSAGGGDVVVTITDASDPNCSITVTITDPGPCSNQCDISSAGLANVQCNDNGTPSDPADDFITFDLNPTGTNLGSFYVVSVNSGSINPGNGSYGAPTSFQLQPGSAGGGDVQITIRDGDSSLCVLTFTLIDPGPCSDQCDLTSAGLANLQCNDNGTPSDTTDDFIVFDLDPMGNNLGLTYNVTVNSGTVTPGSGTYGGFTTFQLQPGSAGGGDIQITITDADSASCSITITLTDPGPCSDQCAIANGGLSNVVCNDNGTPSDPTDDIIVFDLNPTGSNLGGSYNVVVSPGMVMPGSGTYGSPTTFQLQPGSAGAGDVQITILDADSTNCTITLALIDPGTCSDSCNISSAGLVNIQCNDNGTPSDTTDDYIVFDLNPMGSNLGGTYNVSVNSGTVSPGAGTYGSVTTFQLQPGSAGAGDVIVTITDAVDPNCSITVTITDPGTCSGQCNLINAGLANVLCNDNGTPSDPADDIITFDLNPGGNNLGGTYNVTVNTGTITPGSGSYGAPTNFQLQPGSAGGGNVVVTITDADDPNCFITVTIVDPGSCSPQCNLSGAGLANVLCNDNGTPTDPTDDFITFDLNPSGTNLGSTYNVTVNPGTVTPGNGTYGSVTNFQLQQGSAGSGDVVVTITDASDPNCSITVTIVDPGSCSPQCAISAAVSNVSCDDNGTPSDPSDDVFTFDVVVTGSNTGPGWTADDPGNTTGSYGATVSFGPFDISGGTVNFTITDDLDPNCTTTISVPPPATCSNQCVISHTVSNILCNDNGTPADSTDDVFTFVVIVSGMNTAAGWTADDPGNTGGLYNQPVNFGPFPISGGTVTFTITDNADPNCTTLVTVNPPNSCSGQCSIGNLVDSILCNDNGTPTDPADDFFTFRILVNGSNTGNGWNANDPNNSTGAYGVNTTLGPYPIAGGDLTFQVFDNADPNCFTNVFVAAPASCSDSCVISANVTAPVCNDNGTPSDPSDDTYTFVVTVTGANTGNGWLADDPQAQAGQYNVPTLFGPYPAGSDLSFTISDLSDPNCNVAVTVTSPGPCSSGCPPPFVSTITTDTCDQSLTGVMDTTTFQDAAGCDSLIVIRSFNILSGDSTFVPAFSCNPSDTGTTVVVLTNQDGCDSVVTTQTTLLPAAFDTLNAGLCPGDTLVLNGIAYAMPGNFQDTLPGGAANGCDSILTIQLFALTIDTQFISSSLCFGDSLVVNGSVYNESNPAGTEILQAGSSNGCDSVIVVDLTFGAAAVNNLMQSLCPGDSLVVNGVTYNASNPAGSDTIPNGSSGGCDSIINVSLTFFTIDTFLLQQDLCEGDSLVVNGVAYSASNPSGTEVLPGGAANGCDSVILVDLTILQPASDSVLLNLCFGDSIVINGVTYDAVNPSGVERIAGGAANSCDSIVVIDLVFSNAITDSLSASICAGEFFLFQNDTLRSAGFYTDTLQGVAGCDSILVLDLEVFDSSLSVVSGFLCAGDSVVVNGVVYDENNPFGTEVLPGAAATGCDSIVTIDLIFGNAAIGMVSPVLCPGDSITINGTTYSASMPTGSDTIPNGSTAGCDSIIQVSLSFYPVDTAQLMPVLCRGGTITVNGTVYDENNPSGLEVLAGATVNGCDSLIEVSLSFYPVDTAQLMPVLCRGGTITVNGTVYDENNPSGLEVLAGATVNGCDSLIEVSLSFYPVDTAQLMPVLCRGGTITVNGTVYDENNPSGLEVLPGATVNGCDSLIEVSLSFYAVDTVRLMPVLCRGGTITVNGTVYDENNPSGLEVLPGATVNGCDSLIEVSLSFYAVDTVRLMPVLCRGGTITVNGTVYDENNPSGLEVLPGATVNGCDSIIQVSLSFYPVDTAQLMPVLCRGGTITVNGTVYDENNPSGLEVLAGATVNGCDSIIQVSLSFYPVDTAQLMPVLCRGGMITVNGTVYDENNPSGLEVLAGATVNGCDSIIQVSLSFYPVDTAQLMPVLCRGGTITVNGTVYDENNPSGLEVLAGATVNGCDSLIEVSLSFYAVDTARLMPVLCRGGTITVNGTVYDENNPSGLEVLAGATVNGCDSIIQVSLSFYAVDTTRLSPVICPNSVLIINGTEYSTQNPSGIEVIPGAGANGCDSIIEVRLGFFPISVATITQTLCAGEFLIINGVRYDESNPFGRDTIFSGAVSGCDSILVVALEFEQAVVNDLMEVLCPDDFLVLNGTIYDIDNPSGTEIISGGASNGCDSIINVQLRFTGLSVQVDTIPPACFGGGDGKIVIQTINGGTPPYLFALNDQPFSMVGDLPFELSSLPAGNYILRLTDAEGCGLEVAVALPSPSPPILELGPDITLQLGDSARLIAITNLIPAEVRWTPPVNCGNCLDPFVSPVQNTLYQLEIVDSSGCNAQASLTVSVNKRRDVFIPNVFSPDGNGFNDLFYVFADEKAVRRVRVMRIFDRWGEEVFNRSDFRPNDPSAGWNGTFRGKYVDPGVYVYYVEIEYADETVEVLKGDVTIIK